MACAEAYAAAASYMKQQLIHHRIASLVDGRNLACDRSLVLIALPWAQLRCTHKARAWEWRVPAGVKITLVPADLSMKTTVK